MNSNNQDLPNLRAIELCRRHLALKDKANTLRAMAAQLRRDAKVAAIKADAVAMKVKAKELSSQAALAKKRAERIHKEFVTQSEYAHKNLAQRMPPPMGRLGCGQNTRLYQLN